MLPLVRPGRSPLRRLCCRLLSSPQTLSPCSPYTISGGGGNLSPLLLLLSARPSRFRVGEGAPAARAASGAQRGMGFCARAVDVDDGASSSSAAAGSDWSSPYLSVRIRCRKEDAVSIPLVLSAHSAVLGQFDAFTYCSMLFTQRIVFTRVSPKIFVANQEVLSEALLCFGASSVTVDDIADAANLDEISITSIYADGEDVGSSVSNAASSAGLDYSPVYETSVGKQCDWVAAVQETYESTKVIDGLWVIPKWRTAPDPQATNIIINPGLAFGTGEHSTTKLCLLLLREVIKGGEHVLDYGTGTGVLGIAALKMGAALSTGIDIDPQAVTSACENMLLNGIDSNKMRVYLVPTDVQSSCFRSSIDKSEENKPTSNLKSSRGTYDIVAANILLNPLLELVDDIVGYAKPGGIVAVSGILSEQVLKVEEVYSRYLDSILVSEMDGWACLQGTRRV